MLALPILALVVPISANRLFLIAKGGVLEVESKEWDGERGSCPTSAGAVLVGSSAVGADEDWEDAASGRCSSLSVDAKRPCWEVAPSRLVVLGKESIVHRRERCHVWHVLLIIICPPDPPTTSPG